ncbi:MAG: KOW domain-containing RNA-binding protein [Synergistaceae bacterium]|jgi:ribosomal protein L14E/L6E/L27E|nr:KOW domain-containing RNA-binding protein [Synergistaceae bacterium]
MGKLLNAYRVGQVVISKRGKDVGRAYVIVGFLGEDKLALADGMKFNVDRPKHKNPKHVQATSQVVAEVAAWVESGKNIDRGELCRILPRLKGTLDVKDA